MSHWAKGQKMLSFQEQSSSAQKRSSEKYLKVKFYFTILFQLLKAKTFSQLGLILMENPVISKVKLPKTGEDQSHILKKKSNLSSILARSIAITPQ